MRRSLASCGDAHRAQWRRRVCRERTPRKHSTENGGFSCYAGELGARLETRCFYPARQDGAVCFKSATAARTDLCFHSKRGSLSPTRALVGNLSCPRRFLRQSGQGDCSRREVFAQEQVGYARRPHGDYQRRADGPCNDRFGPTACGEMTTKRADCMSELSKAR